MRLSFIFTLLLFSFRTEAAMTNVNCAFLEISNAVFTASNGDTVNIAAGSCYISNTITWSNNFTLKGAGTNATQLISKAGLAVVFSYSGKGNTNLMVISDLDCVGDIANNTGFFYLSNTATNSDRGMFRLYNVQMTNVLYRGIYAGVGDLYGLIDHCTFVVGPSPASYNEIIFGGAGFTSWSNAIPYGSQNVVCVEDCAFINDSAYGGNGHFDGYNGMQAVVRHCYFRGGAYTGVHGYDSQVTSSRSLEVYNNIWTNMNLNAATCLARGGGFMFFSNDIYSTAMSASAISPQLQYYRAAYGAYQGFHGWPFWNLTNSYTTNFAAGDTLGIGMQTYYFVSSYSGSDSRVVIGATLKDSLDNLCDAINRNPATAGTKYAASTTRNNDFVVAVNDSTHSNIVLLNILDGTNTSYGVTGYPAAMQHGVMGMIQYTNLGVVQFPCYSWSNLYRGSSATQLVNFGRTYEGNPAYNPNYVTNYLVLNRDYYSDVNATTATNYTPLAYPHPLQNYTPPSPPSVVVSGISIQTLYIK